MRLVITKSTKTHAPYVQRAKRTLIGPRRAKFATERDPAVLDSTLAVANSAR